MNLCLIGHSYKYELEKLIRIFLPFEKIEFFDTLQISDCCAVTKLCDYTATAELYIDRKIYSFSENVDRSLTDIKKEEELKLATALFKCLTEAFCYKPQWGLLTGVRPAKLFSRLSKSDGIDKTEDYFKNSLFVSDKKIELCKAAVKGEGEITSLSKPDSFSLYISIPFCPSRCSYCSFVSHSVEQAKKLIPQYVENLCKELEITAKTAIDNKLRLETVYIGGGTPTAISAEQLDVIMKTVASNFDLSNVREYTVEAGRPDTVTKEKLTVIKNNGATRISINPQTMNDSVLEAIGRRHTAEQVKSAFYMARECGHNNINMDLIAGLPTDNIDSFKNTLSEILTLDPESVTVHSLSFKRAADLSSDSDKTKKNIGSVASVMVDFSYKTLVENGILPYYMYRQSKTVGNLENVGYAKKGFECLYNVYIMDETHTILACGASAVTKLREPDGEHIERIFNFKYPYEYISRFDEIIARKSGITEFYNLYK